MQMFPWYAQSHPVTLDKYANQFVSAVGKQLSLSDLVIEHNTWGKDGK